MFLIMVIENKRKFAEKQKFFYDIYLFDGSI